MINIIGDNTVVQCEVVTVAKSTCECGMGGLNFSVLYCHFVMKCCSEILHSTQSITLTLVCLIVVNNMNIIIIIKMQMLFFSLQLKLYISTIASQ